MQIGTRKGFIQRPYCGGNLPQQGLSRRFIAAMQQDKRDHHQACDAPQEILTFSEWVVRFAATGTKRCRQRRAAGQRSLPRRNAHG